MAEFRSIHTVIWEDDWFSTLDAEEKVIFIYLFSNHRASVSGIYKVPLRFIEFETGISKGEIICALKVFEEEGKAYYDFEKSVVWVKSLRKYNETSSPKVVTRIKKDIDSISDCKVKALYCEYHSIPYQYPIDTCSENESETEKETETETEKETEDAFSSIQKILESILGIPPSGKACSDAIDELVKMGATREDIQEGYNWYKDNNNKTIRFYSSLVGPSRTAIAKRKQNKPSSTDWKFAETYE